MGSIFHHQKDSDVTKLVSETLFLMCGLGGELDKRICGDRDPRVKCLIQGQCV